MSGFCGVGRAVRLCPDFCTFHCSRAPAACPPPSSPTTPDMVQGPPPARARSGEMRNLVSCCRGFNDALAAGILHFQGRRDAAVNLKPMPPRLFCSKFTRSHFACSLYCCKQQRLRYTGLSQCRTIQIQIQIICICISMHTQMMMPRFTQ